MRFNEMKFAREYVLRFKIVLPEQAFSKDEIEQLNEGQLFQIKKGTAKKQYTLYKNEASFAVEIQDQTEKSDLDFDLHRQFANIVEVIQYFKESQALDLKIVFFISQVEYLPPLEIFWDEKAFSDIRKKKRLGMNSEEMSRRLLEDVTFQLNGKNYFIIDGGFDSVGEYRERDTRSQETSVQQEEKSENGVKESEEGTKEGEDKNNEGERQKEEAKREDLKEEREGKDEKEESREKEEPAPERSALSEFRSCSIRGQSLRLDIAVQEMPDGSQVYALKRLAGPNHFQLGGGLRLICADLKFSTEKVAQITTDVLGKLYAQDGSYFHSWDTYSVNDLDLKFQHARDVKLSVEKISQDVSNISKDNCIRLHLAELPKELTENDTILACSKLPIYLSNPTLTGRDYLEMFQKNPEILHPEKLNRGEANTNLEYVFEISQIESSHTSILLKNPEGLTTEMLKGLHFVVSLKGDLITAERRFEAREKIRTASSANPELGLIIDKDGKPVPKKASRITPLTYFVQEKVFRNPPTPRQIEAISIALNTPDIAVIQGPPGTGKTTVILAILERLNQLHNKARKIRGEILVSAYQHDAVENILSRLRINDLPGIKFGRRSTGTEDFFSQSVSVQEIERWTDNLIENLKAENPEITVSHQQKELQRLLSLYLARPSRVHGTDLLKKIKALPPTILTSELQDRTDELLEEFMEKETAAGMDFKSAVALVRALRVHEITFADDGADTAWNLLQFCKRGGKGILSEEEEQLLQEAADWSSSQPLHFLPEMKKLKRRLLETFLKEPAFRKEKVHDGLSQLFLEVTNQFQKQVLNNTVPAILADYIHELEDNPMGIQKAIEDYCFVFSSTTGQAESEDMHRAKGILRKGSKEANAQKAQKRSIVFDTVIIDEAARAIPPDLLIPMAQARKRIILVGDHRQLPHIVDEQVANACEMDDSQNVSMDIFHKSLFEVLYTRAGELEKRDNIKRRVTLDAQYRTHPLLGNFVSKNFYEKFNKEEGFTSPRPAEDFQHQLAGIENQAAVWINVPNIQGGDKKANGSRYRKAEADCIAALLQKWMFSPEGEKLTFGIISFYREQVECICQQLGNCRITEKDSRGKWNIRREFRFVKDSKEERLQIGTVDAFQGKEFDVVFLSPVLSKSTKELNDVKNKNRHLAKIFSRLYSAEDMNSENVRPTSARNLLCVAMSRQKKVLITTGDAAFFGGAEAQQASPEMYDFLRLCREKGVVIDE